MAQYDNPKHGGILARVLGGIQNELDRRLGRSQTTARELFELDYDMLVRIHVAARDALAEMNADDPNLATMLTTEEIGTPARDHLADEHAVRTAERVVAELEHIIEGKRSDLGARASVPVDTLRRIVTLLKPAAVPATSTLAVIDEVDATNTDDPTDPLGMRAALKGLANAHSTEPLRGEGDITDEAISQMEQRLRYGIAFGRAVPTLTREEADKLIRMLAQLEHLRRVARQDEAWIAPTAVLIDEHVAIANSHEPLRGEEPPTDHRAVMRSERALRDIRTTLNEADTAGLLLPDTPRERLEYNLAMLDRVHYLSERATYALPSAEGEPTATPAESEGWTTPTPDPEQWSNIMDRERRRQIEKGYDDAHDRQHGARHLMNEAIERLRLGKVIQASTMIREAMRLLDRHPRHLEGDNPKDWPVEDVQSQVVSQTYLELMRAKASLPAEVSDHEHVEVLISQRALDWLALMLEHANARRTSDGKIAIVSIDPLSAAPAPNPVTVEKVSIARPPRYRRVRPVDPGINEKPGTKVVDFRTGRACWIRETTDDGLTYIVVALDDPDFAYGAPALRLEVIEEVARIGEHPELRRLGGA